MENSTAATMIGKRVRRSWIEVTSSSKEIKPVGVM